MNGRIVDEILRQRRQRRVVRRLAFAAMFREKKAHGRDQERRCRRQLVASQRKSKCFAPKGTPVRGANRRWNRDSVARRSKNAAF